MIQGESFQIEFEDVSAVPKNYNTADEIIITVRVNNVEMNRYKKTLGTVAVDGTNSALVLAYAQPDETKLWPPGMALIEMAASFSNANFPNGGEVLKNQYVEWVKPAITTTA